MVARWLGEQRAVAAGSVAMAHVFSPSGSSAFGSARRLGRRARGIDWRVVAMTAASAITVIAMMGRPLA